MKFGLKFTVTNLRYDAGVNKTFALVKCEEFTDEYNVSGLVENATEFGLWVAPVVNRRILAVTA